MKEGAVYYSIKGSSCLVKLVGNIHHGISSKFDMFLEDSVSDRSIEEFVVDLNETTYMDSTTLGVLAKLRHFEDRFDHLKPATFFSTNADVNDLLRNVGFFCIFNIVESDSIDDNCLNRLPNCSMSASDLRSIIYDAHKSLMNINEKNRDMFQDVVKYLDKEMN